MSALEAFTNLATLKGDFAIAGNLIYFSFVTLTTTGYGDIAQYSARSQRTNSSSLGMNRRRVFDGGWTDPNATLGGQRRGRVIYSSIGEVRIRARWAKPK